METTVLIIVFSILGTFSLGKSQTIFEEHCKQMNNYKMHQIRMFDKILEMMEARLSLFESKIKQDFENFKNNVQDSFEQRSFQLDQTLEEQRKFMLGEINNISTRMQDLEVSQSSVANALQKQSSFLNNEISNISTRIQDMESYLTSAINAVHSILQLDVFELKKQSASLKTRVEKAEKNMDKNDVTYLEIVKNISRNSESLNEIYNDISLIESEVNNTVQNIEHSVTFKVERRMNATEETLSSIQVSIHDLQQECKANWQHFEIRLNESNNNYTDLIKQSFLIIEKKLGHLVEEGQRKCLEEINSTKTYIDQVTHYLSEINITHLVNVNNTQNSLESLSVTINSSQYDIYSLYRRMSNVTRSIFNLQNAVRLLTNSDSSQNVQFATIQSEHESYSTSIIRLTNFVQIHVQVRLRGNGVTYGTVEVYYVEQWGTVCDDNWDQKDAFVVCRMLGYSGGHAYSYAHFGQGTGEIWLDEVQCTGTESSLRECPQSFVGVHDCSHNEDAGVSCY